MLLFNDAVEDPLQYASDQVLVIVKHMVYEGKYPPSVKKLMHPQLERTVVTFDVKMVS